MKNTYMFTGFPGFLSFYLLRDLLLQKEKELKRVYLLVLPTMLERARQELRRLTAMRPEMSSLFTLLPGDITKWNLDLDPAINRSLQDEVTHLFHLAAIYDLAVPQPVAATINIQGTAYVNAWAARLKRLQRYIYFSTAYVSGTREGRILETQLEMGQSFKNHYEETKYEAELLVEALKGQFPLTIIRPGIVYGDAQTGATPKFDGFYFMLNLFYHLRSSPWIPYLGSGEAEGNFVPVNYVSQAAVYLAHGEQGVGKTYHLTDPNPYTMGELYRLVLEAYLGKTPRGRLPLGFVTRLLSFSRIRRWLQVEQEALAYFTIRASYDASQAVADLAGSGISCPDLAQVLPQLLAYYGQHRDDPRKQLEID